MLERNLEVWTPLTVRDMEAALVARNAEHNRFGAERATYVGASEIGGCPRAVAHRKVDPEAAAITDPAALGRMLMGQLAEQAVVSILRSSHLGPLLRDTGANQKEIQLEDAPIRVHPDGTILRLPVPEGASFALVADATGALVQVAAADLEGPGVLEIKSYGGGAFTLLRKKGLSDAYVDQVQVQMGATGRKWALVVAACREDVSRVQLFVLRFDAERYEALKARARFIMASVQAILDGADPDTTLPAPDVDRGYCDSCPLAYSCPAHAVAQVVEGATFPADAALEVEVLAEEYAELAPMGKRLQEVKDSLKSLFEKHPVASHTTESGAKLSRAYTPSRASCDTKRLNAEFPLAYAATVTTSEPSMWVRFTPPKVRK